jgi:hypothetical protein
MIRDPRYQILAGRNGDITGGTQKGSIGRQWPTLPFRVTPANFSVTPTEWFTTSRTDQPGHGDCSDSCPARISRPVLTCRRSAATSVSAAG